MEDDRQSVATLAAGKVLTIEQQSTRLRQTRDQLKASIARIVAMEEREVQSLDQQVSELITQVTNNSTLLAEHTQLCERLETQLSVLEEVKPGYNSDDSNDSIAIYWAKS